MSRVSLRLNPVKDQDVAAWLDQQDNKSEAIKRLIRAQLVQPMSGIDRQILDEICAVYAKGNQQILDRIDSLSGPMTVADVEPETTLRSIADLDQDVIDNLKSIGFSE